MEKLYKKKIFIALMAVIIAIAIFLSCAVFSLNGNNTAEAFNTSTTTVAAKSTQLGELLIDGYSTTGRGKIFDGDVFWPLVSIVTGLSDPNESDLASWSTTKTSKDFRTANVANGSLDLSVTIDGLSWTPTYLSYNTSGDPILTFWLSTATSTAVMNVNSSTALGKYPSNMYGTTYLRASVLNNGGGYAAAYNDTELTEVSQDPNSEWAIYTMDKTEIGGSSIKEFIEVPDNISWQHNKSAKTTTGAGFDYNNDALDIGGSYSAAFNYYSNATINTDGNHTTYQGWKDDTLWIPGLMEVGLSSEKGLWVTSANLRTNNANCWLRSGRPNYYNQPFVLTSTGGYGNPAVNTSCLVRPAFHLNLKLAAARAGGNAQEPKDVTVVYNGQSQTIANVADAQKSWYDPSLIKLTYPTTMTSVGEYKVTAEISDEALEENPDCVFNGDPDPDKDETATKRYFTFKITEKLLEVSWDKDDYGAYIPSLDNDEIYGSDVVNLNVKYEGILTASGASYGPSSTPPKNAGEYTVTIESLSNPNYAFATGTVRSKSFTLDIRKINLPTLTSTSWLTYNGSPQLYFINATSYDSDDIEITRPAEFTDDDFTFASNIITVKNVNAKDEENWYYLTLTLKDKDNTVWAGTEDIKDKQLLFKILPFEVEIELNDGISTMSVMFGEDSDMYIEVTKEILTGHTLTFDITATFNGMSFTLLSGLELDEDSTRLSKTLLTSNLPAPNISCTLNFVLSDGEADNGNFHITCNSVTINVEEEGSGRDTWRITKSTGGYYGSRFYTNMGTQSVAYTETITFDGTTYGIEFIPSTVGQSVDTTYNTDGYVNGYLTEGNIASNNAIGKNADTYTTYVRVIDSNNDNAIVTYQITWTISPYKFDLTGVTWKNDGKYEYTGSPISPSLENLPKELELNLFGTKTGTAVKSYGTVTASFGIADGYVESNYILPEDGEDGSYDGDFTWSINWEITPMQIKVTTSNWTYVDETDENEVAFQVLQLKDATLKDIVAYEYYLTDAAGNIIDDTPYDLDDIIVSATATQYFKTKPVITLGNEANYLLPDEAYSPVFSVGGGATEITITLTTDQYTYTGKAVSLKWKAGTPTASLDFKYYIGDAFGNAIDYTPTEVGTYWVEVTSKNPAVILDGGSARFQFWINKSVIDTQWKTTAKPPVLANLKSIQLTEGIEYEYYDADMHKITFSDLSAGGTFFIRAILKDTKNFEFDNGDVQTDTIQFTLAAGEELRDPSDISNPNYSFDDEDEDEDEDDDDEKPTIPLEWDTTKNPPELKIPDEYKDDIHPEYEYFDKNGNPVKPEDMVEGEDYTVKVTIPQDELDKFNFVDKNGNTIEDPNDIPEYSFEKKDDTATGSLDLGNIVQYWPLMVSAVSVILIIIFLSKTASNGSKRKKFNKKAEKLERVYAAAPLLGIAFLTWEIIAFTLLGLAVVSFVMMLISKSRLTKAEENYEDALAQYDRAKKDEDKENMRMMFMSMMGGQGVQGMQGAYAGGMQLGLGAEDIRGIVSETMTAMLPGVQQMLPQQAGTNDELVQKLIDQNEKLMEKSQKNEEEIHLLLKKLTEQQPANTERIVEKLVATTNNSNDEVLKSLIEGQRIIMEKLASQTAQVIEKEVVKEVPVEKIVEKEVKVEVPVEVVKEVPVEKIVEKIVEKEVPVEKVVEVPVEVVKEVPIKVEVIKEVPVKAEPKPKKETAPRLTLDEAYALLTKEQKKFFDGLKQYVLDKYKCKEKKTTYFVTYGQTATNPLLKLMIKKDITVALLKMEDELMKDIRRDATGDGTKVKVKETEILVTDSQAFETAKKMVDLRYDQIERYQDLLKEQRAMRK